MMQLYKKVNLNSGAKKIFEFTDILKEWIHKNKLKEGIITISILHTSASLLIQENADGSVLKDLENFYKKIAPFNKEYYHSSEGKDDMPAHIKSSLLNTNLCLSIIDSELLLGIWQGLFLFEHRLQSRERTLIFHFLGKLNL